MADENNEDDSWLYGSSNNENQSEDPNNDTEEPADENESKVDGENADSNVRLNFDDSVEGNSVYIFLSLSSFFRMKLNKPRLKVMNMAIISMARLMNRQTMKT